MIHEQVNIGGGRMGAHGHVFDLGQITGVEGEGVHKDKFCELNKELCGW